MKIKLLVNVQDMLRANEVEIVEVVKVIILDNNGHQMSIKMSENGGLDIEADNRLAIYPGASNWIHIRQER